MKMKQNKLLVHVFINGALLLLLLASYILLPNLHQPLDSRLRDLLFQARGERDDSGQIVIVKIDEPSLAALGQWPWSRDKLARILAQLDAAGALLIGMDIVFAEADRSSPHWLASQFQLETSGLPNYDQILAQRLALTPVVLGHFFEFSPAQGTARSLSALKQNPASDQVRKQLPQATKLIPNLPDFEAQAISAGFLNYFPDADGLARTLPMLIQYRNALYPSLALEIFRQLQGAPEVELVTARSAFGTIQHEVINGIRLGQSFIPTTRDAGLYLDYLGPSGAFEELSAEAVFHGSFDPALVRQKLVLIGASAIGLKDLRQTPFAVDMPGVEIHATALDNLISGRHLQRPDWVTGLDVVQVILLGLLLGLVYPRLSAPGIAASFLLAGYGLYQLHLWLLFDQRLIANLLFPFATLVLLTISSSLANYYFENRQKQQIKSRFAKKLSAAVVEDILKHGDDDMLIGRNREVSIFFSDVRSFTSITESLGSPEKVIDLLNIYMTPMVDAIMDSEGTLDKFIGDAIMAYWNAPGDQQDHADRALCAALKQLELLGGVNQQLQAKYGLEIDIGIGINTGNAIVGEMGSRGRSDYTIIGDSVNLASRLEGLCKQYGARLIISDHTRVQLTRDFPMRELDLVRVKGKRDPVAIFEVLTSAQAPTPVELQDYRQALGDYRSAEFNSALAHFQRLEQAHPCTLYRLYRERCELYCEAPPEQFDGIFVHTSK